MTEVTAKKVILKNKDGEYLLPYTDAQGSGLAVGTIISHFASANFVPENCLPCDGTEYSATQFQTLWDEYLSGDSPKLLTCTYEEYEQAISNTGACPKFALDNSKFKVPYIPDGYVIQQGVANAGNAFKAGLPNIKTEYEHGMCRVAINNYSELLPPLVSVGTSNSAGSGGVPLHMVNLDISTINSVYGNSDTVQPNAVALRYFVVISTGSINQSSMDWSQWATSLSGKVNFDLSNCSKPYVTETYQNGASWYRLWSDGWCEQGGFVGGSGSNLPVTFIKTFKDTNFSLSVQNRTESSNTSICTHKANSITNSGFNLVKNSTAEFTFSWEAHGYIGETYGN